MFKLLNAVSGGLTQSQLIAIGAFCLIFILLVLILKFIVNCKKKPKYFKKQSLLTATEVKYLQVLSAIVGENYLIYPQINLASVIEKKGDRALEPNFLEMPILGFLIAILHLFC